MILILLRKYITWNLGLNLKSFSHSSLCVQGFLWILYFCKLFIIFGCPKRWRETSKCKCNKKNFRYRVSVLLYILKTWEVNKNRCNKRLQISLLAETFYRYHVHLLWPFMKSSLDSTIRIAASLSQNSNHWSSSPPS